MATNGNEQKRHSFIMDELMREIDSTMKLLDQESADMTMQQHGPPSNNDDHRSKIDSIYSMYSTHDNRFPINTQANIPNQTQSPISMSPNFMYMEQISRSNTPAGHPRYPPNNFQYSPPLHHPPLIQGKYPSRPSNPYPPPPPANPYPSSLPPNPYPSSLPPNTYSSSVTSNPYPPSLPSKPYPPSLPSNPYPPSLPSNPYPPSHTQYTSSSHLRIDEYPSHVNLNMPQPQHFVDASKQMNMNNQHRPSNSRSSTVSGTPGSGSFSRRPSKTPISPDNHSISASSLLNKDSISSSRKQAHRKFEVPQENTVAAARAMQYLDRTLVSNLALTFRDCVPLGTHTKGVIDFPNSFTGKDAITTICTLLECHRRVALSVARSLESQLFIHEVDWEGRSTLSDSVTCVYTLKSLPMASLRLDDEIPTGVFASVGKCYSPSCQLGMSAGQCYSASCPTRQGPLILQGSTPIRVRSNSIAAESISTSTTSQTDRTWSSAVSPTLLEKLPHKEIKRQEIIYETIYTEEDYIDDLSLLDTLFIKELRSGGVIPTGRLEMFITTVFQNISQIRKYNEEMYELLIIRQREQSPVITNIGDVFLDAARKFGEAYVNYNSQFPFAEAWIKQERTTNPEFSRFLDRCMQDSRTRRLDFRHFVQRPTTRMQRYTLLLEQIQKATEEGNSDYELLGRALETIRRICRESDSRLHESEQKLKVQEINSRLVFKHTGVDMDLLASDRVLVHKGSVKRKSDTGLETLDIFLLLFDNYLVMTKERTGPDGLVQYYVSKNPIPIDMLVLNAFSDGSIKSGSFQVSIHLHSRVWNNSQGHHGQTALAAVNGEVDDGTSTGYPFTITHLGRNGATYTLFADSQAGRKKWREKISETIEKRKAVNETRKVFEINTLTDTTFGQGPGTLGNPLQVDGPSVARYKGRVLCSTAFRAPDGRHLVAIGTDDGVWVGMKGQSGSFSKVLNLRMVNQMACMQEFGVFIVLAERILLGYPMEVLLNSQSPAVSNPQKITTAKDILFFNIGKIQGRPLLIYMRKKGVESHFAALEPVAGKAGVVVKNQSTSTLKFFQRNSGWFNEYKAFFIPSDSYGIQFLSAKVCIVCARGFEIMRLDSLIPGTIPDLRDPRFGHIARRCEHSKPLGMFKLGEDEFLLCYDEFAFWVDKHGDLLKDRTIEWEGRPEFVCLSLPYVVAFDRDFIEVHDVMKGEMVQVITGPNIKCLNAEQMESGRIHAVMQNPLSEYQMIFELVPVRR